MSMFHLILLFEVQNLWSHANSYLFVLLRIISILNDNVLIMCDCVRTLFGEDFLTLGKWFAQLTCSGSNDNRLVIYQL